MLRDENRVQLRTHGYVVWLTADAATLCGPRIQADHTTAAPPAGVDDGRHRRGGTTSGDSRATLPSYRRYRRPRGNRVAGTGRGRYPCRMNIPFAEIVWVIFAFIIGVNVGSFLNVVVGRLPLEKSILWPNSRCLSCLHSLSGFDNLPIIGWLRRRGRCRYCGSHFSSRYMWVELATGYSASPDCSFSTYWSTGTDTVHGPALATRSIGPGFAPWEVLPFFLHHAVLFSLLVAAALCDWDHRSIPLTLTVTGTLFGLASAMCWPWPWPNSPALFAGLNQPVLLFNGQIQPRNWAFNVPAGDVKPGLYPWPVWGPVPDWLWNHRWALGLLTGLTGAAVGMFMIRAVKFTFEKGLGREALGLGDADLMMMAGAFLGLATGRRRVLCRRDVVSLPVGIVFRLVKKEEAFPFGPGLALGIMITMLCWRWIGPVLQLYLFEPMLVLVAVVVMAGGLFIGSIVVRAISGRQEVAK